MTKELILSLLLGVLAFFWILYLVMKAPEVAPKQQSQKISISTSIEETIRQHNKESDCWVTINGKIYDLTTYIQSHPAGPESITKYCGNDATVGFETKDGKGGHSKKAAAVLEAYQIKL